MGILILVSRSIDVSFKRTGKYISFAEWVKLVEGDPSLRIRTEPYAGVNPATGERIRVRTGEADSEIEIGGGWFPFLRYREGELTIRFTDELDDPRNPIRNKIAAIAKTLNALITHDAGEEILRW